MINQIGINQISGKGYHQSESRIKQSDLPEAKPAGDRVSLSNSAASYTEYTVKGEFTIEPDSQYYSLKSIVSSMLSEQGMTIGDALESKPYIIDEATKEEAASLVAEDGYWGVEQTSDRILQFAINAAGNDTSKIDDVKTAIENGFKMALDSFGGTLPEISYQTYDAVLEKLEQWADEGTGEETDTIDDEE